MLRTQPGHSQALVSLTFAYWSRCPRYTTQFVEALRSMDITRLMVIWPNYVDSTRTIKKGRRIPKASACEFERQSPVWRDGRHLERHHVSGAIYIRRLNSVALSTFQMLMWPYDILFTESNAAAASGRAKLANNVCTRACTHLARIGGRYAIHLIAGQALLRQWRTCRKSSSFCSCGTPSSHSRRIHGNRG